MSRVNTEHTGPSWVLGKNSRTMRFAVAAVMSGKTLKPEDLVKRQFSVLNEGGQACGAATSLHGLDLRVACAVCSRHLDRRRGLAMGTINRYCLVS